MKNLRFSLKTIPAALLLLSILAYGLLIPWIGFYWDDWPFAWLSHFFGPAEFFPAFLPFRPFLGPIFFVTTGLLGENPLAWQVFGVLLRFATGLAAWWSLGSIWPAHKRQTAVAALAFVLFPGYLSQWVAFTHTNQEMVSLLAYLLSLGMTARALRSPRPAGWTAASMALAFIALFPTEYFFPLELLRPIILWFLLEGSEPRLTRRALLVLRRWLPCLAVWIANILWLAFYYNSSWYGSYGVEAVGILQQPLAQIPRTLLEELVKAVATAGFAAWTRPFNLLLGSLGQTANLLIIGLAAISFAGIWFYLNRLEIPAGEAPQGKTPWALQAVIIGLAGIVLGRLPSWAASLPLALEFSWDRFMVSMMFGGALFFAGLLEYFIRDGRRKNLLAAAFLAMAVGQQFYTANTFRRDWENQRTFYWQLVWRAPNLQPGTLLLTHELPLKYETDFSVSAAVNWMYAPELNSRDLPYLLLYTKARLGSDLLPRLEPGQDIIFPYRTTTFRGSTSDVVVLAHPTPGCLRVLDAEISGAETVPGMIYLLTDAIPLSDPQRILTGSPPPALPARIFGAEPPHTWCYYFEKAELARQTGDWQQAADLGRQAQAEGYGAILPAEWLPFIEGYARTGSMEEAQALTETVRAADPLLEPALCRVWERVAEAAADPALKETAVSIQSGLQCSP